MSTGDAVFCACAHVQKRRAVEDGKQRTTLWDGVIEVRGGLGVAGMIPLTDDIPSPGRWADAVQFIREYGDVVYVQDVT